MTNEKQIGGIPVETIDTAKKADLSDVGHQILEQVPSNESLDLDDYTVLDPVTGERRIRPGSDHDSYRDKDGDPITDGGM